MANEVIYTIVGLVISGVLGLAWRSIQASFNAMRTDLATAQAATAAVRVDLDARSVELVQAQNKIRQVESTNQQQAGMITLLQTDNAELRAALAETSTTTAEQGEQIDALTNDSADKAEEITRLKDQNHDLFEQNKKLSTTIEVQREFAREMGRELKASKSEPGGEVMTPDRKRSA